ncbi:MAG: GYD domain-containing protein [Haloferacaceae archaeon]
MGGEVAWLHGPTCSRRGLSAGLCRRATTSRPPKNYAEYASRWHAARAAIREAGSELTAFYLTMGEYDAVAVAEYPDATTAASVWVGISQQGAVRVHSMRAFDDEERAEIVEQVGGRGPGRSVPPSAGRSAASASLRLSSLVGDVCEPEPVACHVRRLPCRDGGGTARTDVTIYVADVSSRGRPWRSPGTATPAGRLQSGRPTS